MKAIIGTDGSACAQVALDLVASLPWPAGSMLRIMSALDPMSFYGPFVGFASGVGELEQSLGTALEESAAAATRQVCGPGCTADHKVVVGRPSTVLCDEAREWQADLMVIGSRGHGPLSSMLLGSTSAEVIDHAHCPVLVARGRQIKRVVMAHDGSDNAYAAEAIVRTWPMFKGAEVTVVSVADSTQVDLVLATDVGLAADSSAADKRESKQQHHEIAEAAARRISAEGKPAAEVVPTGDPAHMIINVAQEHAADLIVLGTRGNTGLKRLILGSVARNVLTHAHCSVLVVPPRD